MTDAEDREIFRSIFDLYQQMKRNGEDRESWERSHSAALQLCEKYQDKQLFVDLLKAIYAEIYRLNDTTEGGEKSPAPRGSDNGSGLRAQKQRNQKGI